MANDNYASLRNINHRFKNSPIYKYRISYIINKWAKDETIPLREFAFLVKKALEYLKASQ